MKLPAAREDIVINFGDSPIAPSMEPPRNLGVLFDSTCCEQNL